MVTITASEGKRAGQNFTMTCAAVLQVEGHISETPQIQWTGPSGRINSSRNGIEFIPQFTTLTVATSVLIFSPITSSHAGLYTCYAFVFSAQQMRNAVYNISVQSELTSVHIRCKVIIFSKVSSFIREEENLV